jgi:hypothetical protein
MLRRVFRLKRRGVRGEYKKLHDEELHNKCYFPNIPTVKDKNSVGHVVAYVWRK